MHIPILQDMLHIPDEKICRDEAVEVVQMVYEGYVDELTNLFGYKGYSMKRAIWKSPVTCGYCKKEVRKGFRIYLIHKDGGHEIYYACSKEHGLRMIEKMLGSRLATALSDPLSAHFATHEKLIMIVRRYHGYVTFSNNVIYCPPDKGVPEIIIKNFYPHISIVIDYIEVSHKDLIASLLDEVAKILLGMDIELLLDLRHTPRDQIMEAKKIVRELYCRYTEYGIRPAEYVVCNR